jgi:hypothetical protein
VDGTSRRYKGLVPCPIRATEIRAPLLLPIGETMTEFAIIAGVLILVVGGVGGYWAARYQATLETRLIKTATKALNKLAHMDLDSSLASQVASQAAQRKAAIEALKAQAAAL